MIVTLVIIMTINGEDFTRREPQSSSEICEANATSVRRQMLEHLHKGLSQLGIGCVIDVEGDPA